MVLLHRQRPPASTVPSPGDYLRRALPQLSQQRTNTAVPLRQQRSRKGPIHSDHYPGNPQHNRPPPPPPPTATTLASEPAATATTMAATTPRTTTKTTKHRHGRTGPRGISHPYCAPHDVTMSRSQSSNTRTPNHHKSTAETKFRIQSSSHNGKTKSFDHNKPKSFDHNGRTTATHSHNSTKIHTATAGTSTDPTDSKNQ
jgi:hypothetical protein